MRLEDAIIVSLARDKDCYVGLSVMPSGKVLLKKAYSKEFRIFDSIVDALDHWQLSLGEVNGACM